MAQKKIRPYAINDFIEYLEHAQKLYSKYYEIGTEYTNIAAESEISYEKG